MPRSHKPPLPLKCEDVRFVEVEFPTFLRPRLVIRFHEGISLLLEDRSAIPLAAEFIAAFRELHTTKGEQPC